MIIMNPFRFAESNKDWMDKAYAEFVASTGLRIQRNPIPENRIWNQFTLDPSQLVQAEKNMKSCLEGMKEGLMRFNPSVIYPEVIVYPTIFNDCYYIFRIQINFA